MLVHGAELKRQASLCCCLATKCYIHDTISLLSSNEYKSLTLCVSQSFLDRFGEHDQQSILLSSCSQQNGLDRTCHEVVLVLLK